VYPIHRQIDKVILTDEFLEIELETLCTLLQRDNLRINECILFKAVLRYDLMIGFSLDNSNKNIAIDRVSN